METIEYNTIDKSRWGDGLWQSEPDHVQWPDPETGLPCIAHRHGTSGHWCGYVGVDAQHPWFKVGYDDISVEVHGGLTYTELCDDKPAGHGICHIPREGESDHVWWLGFDCAHSGDLCPAKSL